MWNQRSALRLKNASCSLALHFFMSQHIRKMAGINENSIIMEFCQHTLDWLRKW